MVDDLWPLRVGWKRVQRYYDLLWQDVYDSEETWEIMETPGDISDDLYHEAFNEVADVLDNLSAEHPELSEWWPCRGTLIALLRHGARSGVLRNGVDVVERDIDLMLGVASEDHWHLLGRAIEVALLQKGWDRCWTKQSASEASNVQFSTRKDLLYCVRMQPAYMMLDITSYISGPDYIYIHRICDETGCFVPAVGPLQHANGLLPRSAIHPIQQCLAKDRAVPCPNEPLETIKAMSHSGLSPKCIALPDKPLQPFDEAGDAGSGGPLQLEDVELLRQRSAELDGKGFLSMTPYFDHCEKETLENETRPTSEPTKPSFCWTHGFQKNLGMPTSQVNRHLQRQVQVPLQILPTLLPTGYASWCFRKSRCGSFPKHDELWFYFQNQSLQKHSNKIPKSLRILVVTCVPGCSYEVVQGQDLNNDICHGSPNRPTAEVQMRVLKHSNGLCVWGPASCRS